MKVKVLVTQSFPTICHSMDYIACQAPLSMEFCRQEYWSEQPFLCPGDLPDPGIESESPALQSDSLPSEPSKKPIVTMLNITSSLFIYCPLLNQVIFFFITKLQELFIYSGLNLLIRYNLQIFSPNMCIAYSIVDGIL